VAGACTALVGALLLAGCAPSSTPTGSSGSGEAPSAPAESASPDGSGGSASSSSTSIAQQDFSLDELVAAAKAEGGTLTVYDSTGKIKDIAEAFSAKYGIHTDGIKMHDPEAIDKMTREAQAGNVTVDVDFITDVPAILGQLEPAGTVTSWIPPDVAQYVPAGQRDPLVVVTDPDVIAYNTDAYPDGCPIDNLWDLADPAWKGKVAMVDPLSQPKLLGFLTAMTIDGADQLSAAYHKQYGEQMTTSEPNAGWEFVKRLAANSPMLFTSGEDVSGAVGAPGQSDPPIGLVSPAKFRNIADKGYRLGLCTSVSPWIGFAAPKAAVIATGTKHPNAAKLFIHYVMTAEGIAPQLVDGKFSSNSQIKPDPDDPSKLGSYLDQVYQFDNASANESWQARQDVSDFWRLNNS